MKENIVVDHERKGSWKKSIYCGKENSLACLPYLPKRQQIGAVYLLSVRGSFSGGDLVSCDNPRLLRWWWAGRLTLRLGRDPVSSPEGWCDQVRASLNHEASLEKFLPNVVRLLYIPCWLFCHALTSRYSILHFHFSGRLDLGHMLKPLSYPETDINFQSTIAVRRDWRPFR